MSVQQKTFINYILGKHYSRDAFAKQITLMKLLTQHQMTNEIQKQLTISESVGFNGKLNSILLKEISISSWNYLIHC